VREGGGGTHVGGAEAIGAAGRLGIRVWRRSSPPARRLPPLQRLSFSLLRRAQHHTPPRQPSRLKTAERERERGGGGGFASCPSFLFFSQSSLPKRSDVVVVFNNWHTRRPTTTQQRVVVRGPLRWEADTWSPRARGVRLAATRGGNRHTGVAIPAPSGLFLVL
jgi:hypothetical protein